MRCQRCGTCCRVDISALLLPGDLERWEAGSGAELAQEVRREAPVWVGDRLLWPDGTAAGSCRFLMRRGSRCTCRIHARRPPVCRAFAPGSSPLCPQYWPEPAASG